MSVIKLVVSDMDNTLLDRKNRISLPNQEAIAALKKAGIHFVLATGRTYLTTQAYAYQIANNEPAITCNGAMVSRLLSGDIIFKRQIPDASLEPLVTFLSEHDCRYLIYTETSVYSSPNNERFAFFRDYNCFARTCGQAEVEVKLLSLPAATAGGRASGPPVDSRALKIFVFSENKALIERLRSLVEADDQLSCAQSMDSNLDIMPAGVSKGSAVLSLAAYYGLDKSEIAVFGDQENDISMMEQAGLSFAMENAGDRVKEKADKLAPHHDRSGFATMVNRYILSQ